MKALSLRAPGELSLIDIPEPAGDGVLLQVDLVGLCGTDLNSYKGLNPLISYPRIPGHEIAATVLEGSERYVAGTKVTVSPYTHCGRCPSCGRGRFNACQFNQTYGVQRDGALVERLRVPESRLYASELLTSRKLSLVEPLTVGFHAVARARVVASDTVAVYGCGGVGLGAISGAAFRKATVIAIDQDDTKLETARAAGAAQTINTRAENVDELLHSLTNGQGPDVVIEAIGLPQTFRAAIEQVAFTGRVVYIGYAKQAVEYETKLFVQKELDILGSRNALPEDFEQVIAMLENGQFPLDRVVSRIVAIEDAHDAVREWSSNPAAFTKILVRLSEE